ncbi:hypothetical protein MIN45_PP01 (plasmid) [Methylomarinovum tepidoasis]|uniref:Replication protein n=1 Tax=Methylomarinovum tepidoasis TaxID=2840183 RepID=A0AAU9CU66_9GAMM|nr:helix-turn-helix domain-containing protein [Methylomarinovum sp. IN45]BCX89988.1 hypothetical protein MIN45_PP01 [Methylomarinovum sp. IN45]
MTPQQFSLDLDHPPEHFEALHREAHGTVLVWEALRPGKRWVKLAPNDPAIPEFLAGLKGKPDTYVSVNEFDGWRLVRLLRSLRAVYVDLDGTTDLDLALDTLLESRMPAPSLTVFSGRGLHLYWLIQPMPPKTLPVWQRITDSLNQALAPIGADPKARDCTRVLRLVGTVNSLNNAVVRGLIITGYRWTLHELANEVLGQRKPRKAPGKAKIRDIHAQAAKRAQRAPQAVSGSIYERWYKVYQDLLAIARHHDGQIPEGYRDSWLFLSGVALSWFSRAESLRDEIENAAQTFTPGLTDREIKAVAKTIQQRAEAAAAGKTIEWQGQEVDPRYRFRRATLHKWLQPLIPETLYPELRAILPDRIARERKLLRDQDRARKVYWQDRESSYTGKGVRKDNEQRRAMALLMRAGGASYRQISEELGVSIRTAYRWCHD